MVIVTVVKRIRLYFGCVVEQMRTHQKTSLVGEIAHLLSKPHISCPYNQCETKSHNLVIASNPFHDIRIPIRPDVLVRKADYHFELDPCWSWLRWSRIA